MTRLVASLVAVTVFVGCTGGMTPLDPFARTTIEPPRTGWISTQPAQDPYYTGAATRQAAVSGPAAGASGSWTASSMSARSGDYRQSPDSYGGRASSFVPNRNPAAGPGDRITIPLAARRSPDESRRVASRAGPETGSGSGRDRADATISAAATSSAVATVRSLAGETPGQAKAGRPATGASGGAPAREVLMRTIQPRPRAPSEALVGDATNSARQEPRRLVIPGRVIDITDLPAAGAASGRGDRSSGIRLVSATEVVDDSGPRGTPASYARTTSVPRQGGDSFSPHTRYGYDPEYRWLRGKLEHSQSDGRWKLRYIPIDGETDEFGGSVVFSDPSLLSGYQRGEFVEVHGKLGRPPSDEREGYAGDFEIHQIKRSGS